MPLGESSSTPAGYLVRFRGDGTIDEHFNAGKTLYISRLIGGASNTNGRRTPARWKDHRRCAYTTSGGNGSSRLLLMRFTDEGKLDTTFGTNGFAFDLIPAVQPDAVFVQPDGRILVAVDDGGRAADQGQHRREYRPSAMLTSSPSRPAGNSILLLQTMANSACRFVDRGIPSDHPCDVRRFQREHVPQLFRRMSIPAPS